MAGGMVVQAVLAGRTIHKIEKDVAEMLTAVKTAEEGDVGDSVFGGGEIVGRTGDAETINAEARRAA